MIRFAEISDIEILSTYDKHIGISELESAVSLGRVIDAEDNGTLLGWLRWKQFWDNTPFMNMLFKLKSIGANRKNYGLEVYHVKKER